MICEQLNKLLGFECSALNDEGTIAYIATPFRFSDGDPVPVYVEIIGEHVRFFDDGEVFLHFRGRGLALNNKRQAKFISAAASNHADIVYSDDSVLQIVAVHNKAAEAFGKYIGALHDICAWERENEGVSEDGEQLVEEVVMAITAANPNAHIQRDQVFASISKKKRTLPIVADGVGIAIASPHHASVNAALHTMVDITQSSENRGKSFLFVLNDKTDPESAKAEASVLQAVAPVRLLSDMERAPSGATRSALMH